MKGLWYAYLTLNRKYWIGAAIAFVVVIAAGVLIMVFADDDPASMGAESLLLMIMPWVAPMVLSEAICRDLEANIRRRFAQYSLCAVTHRTYVMFYFTVLLATTAVGMVLAVATILALCGFAQLPLAGSALISPDDIPFSLFVLAMGNVFTWLMMPLTMELKSHEKAGLVGGLVLGFGVVMPYVLSNISDDGGIQLSMFTVSTEDMLIGGAVMAVVTVIAWLWLLHDVKKGGAV